MTEQRIIGNEDRVGTIPLEMAMKHSGVELFDMMLSGEIPPPPIAKTLNFVLQDAEKGRAVFRGIPLFEHYNPLGVVHGGWASTILDSALGCAVQTALPAGMGYTTIEFKVNLVRPLTKDSGEVLCEGKLIHLGRTTATSEAKLTNRDGKLVAFGTETCAVFPIRKPE